MKLTNATWLCATPGAVTFTEPGCRADQDERWSTAEGDLRLVDEAPALSETTHWSSRVTTKFGCKQRHTTASSWESDKETWQFCGFPQVVRYYDNKQGEAWVA